jgi:hypothetical protein
LTDLGDLPHVDFNNSWWRRGAYEAMGINGRHFGITGDVTMDELRWVWTVCFNKNMIADHGFDSPFDLVKSGDWTFDRVLEMSRAVARDIDGDGAMTENDIWGINYTGDTIMGILIGLGITIAELDSDGIPVLTIGSAANLAKLETIYTRLFDITHSVDTLFQLPNMVGRNVGDFTDTEIFEANRNLFLFTAPHQVEALRQTEVNFGIVPYPKYDQSQPDYRPSVGGIFLPIICVPKTNSDLENTSIFMEAFAEEGSKTIVPAFYDNILMYRMARDEESTEMLQYIFGNIHYDTGKIFNFGDISSTLAGFDTSANRRTTVASMVERNLSRWETAIERLVDEVSN